MIQIPGISKEMAQKLEELGYDSILSVAVETPKHLAEMLEIKESVASRIINLCRKAYMPKVVSAEEYQKLIEEIEHIPTGSEKLDSILNGGIPLMNMTELAGEFGAGKTQTCFTLSVTVQTIGGSCIFIDTENTIRPNRIKQIAEARGVENPLKNIFVIHAPTSASLILSVDKLRKIISEFNKTHENPIKLIVVDSLVAPFRSDFIGRSELPERQQKLGHVLQELQRIAFEKNLAVVFTNQVVAVPDAFGPRLIPTGGYVLSHKSQYRFFIRKSKENKRVFKIIDAPELPELEVIVKITEKGIE